MTESRRPNILFIVADDLGYADLGCTGARDARSRPVDVSPSLDRLAAQGLRYTRAYANSALCSPTRFALITGRWQYRLRGAAEEPIAGARGSSTLGLPAEHPTLPSLLRDAGYRTGLVGKWHLGFPPHFGPRKSGYDHFVGNLSGAVDYFSHVDPSGTHDLFENDEPLHSDAYLTDLFSDKAVEFVRRGSPDQPFLLSLHYNAPHWPWLTRDDRAESQRIGNRIVHTDGGSIATFQRMVHHMDEGIGRVLRELEAQGQADNTIVVFTSDNGGERYSDTWPLTGQKMDLLEGGIRVPTIVRWPSRIAAGGVSESPSLSMDWAATLLEAAGVAPDPRYPLDGVSLLPSFDDTNWKRPGDLFWRMKFLGQRALVRGPWKYLRIDGIDYLFDIANDERERANLSRRHPERLAELRAAWEQWDATMPPIPADARATKVYSREELPASAV